MVPAATPKPVIDKLYQDTAKVLQSPDIRTRFEQIGMVPVGNPPGDLAPAPATAPDLVLNPNPFSETFRTLGHLRGHRAVLNSVLGVSWFWFFGSIFIAQLPAYTKLFLGGDGTVAWGAPDR